MKNNLTYKLGAIGILAMVLTTAIGQGRANAQNPGEHPHYLHARSDLRKAEQLLQLPDERNVKQEEVIAIHQVQLAIAKIDKAAVLDRKDVDDHPKIDTSLQHLGKFRAIESLLQSAKRDISLEEDNAAARSWKRQANSYIDKAEKRVDRAIKRDHGDDQRNPQH
jgi:hypothetical protein